MSGSSNTQQWEAAQNVANSRGRSPSRIIVSQNVQASSSPSHIDERSSRTRSHSRPYVVQPTQGSVLPSGLDNKSSRSTRNYFANQNLQSSLLTPLVDHGNSNNYQIHQDSVLPSQIDKPATNSSSYHWYQQSRQYPARPRTPGVSFMNPRLDQQPRGQHNSYLQSNLDHQSQQYQYPATGVSVMNPQLDQQSREPNNSVLPSYLDKSMAARQLVINSLPPDEKKKQNEWALQDLAMNGSCVAGYSWVRADTPGTEPGYRCMGMNHFVSDKLISENQGGYYERSRNRRSKGEDKWKLKYPDPARIERLAAYQQKSKELLDSLPSSRR